ncbi:oxoglutarate/malate translocator protein [Babesia caballi]|uniref:Oxoglutarate/malate translocator protein n=1 Tax=Babesia caballi TaxID=5871 RepID=A0AAV4LNZ7_BABCB|nr:oxoglutarate/malate translocator protein [Babesia caballi]
MDKYNLDFLPEAARPVVKPCLPFILGGASGCMATTHAQKGRAASNVQGARRGVHEAGALHDDETRPVPYHQRPPEGAPGDADNPLLPKVRRGPLQRCGGRLHRQPCRPRVGADAVESFAAGRPAEELQQRRRHGVSHLQGGGCRQPVEGRDAHHRACDGDERGHAGLLRPGEGGVEPLHPKQVDARRGQQRNQRVVRGHGEPAVRLRQDVLAEAGRRRGAVLGSGGLLRQDVPAVGGQEVLRVLQRLLHADSASHHHHTHTERILRALAPQKALIEASVPTANGSNRGRPS